MTTTISPEGKTSLGGAVTVSEKNPLDDDTRETRVLEIEKLFDAADPQKRGYLDRSTIRELMRALRNGHEVQEVSDTEVDAVFVAFFGQTGAACVDRDSFRRAMLNWLALHDDRPHIFRMHRPARRLDRRRLHGEMGLFFTQFEPPSPRRLLQLSLSPSSSVCPEDEVDRLRRGGSGPPSPSDKEAALERLRAATENDGALLVQVFEALHSADVALASQGLQWCVELLQAMEAFTCPSERFALRLPLWTVLTAMTTSPNSRSASNGRPLPSLLHKVLSMLDDAALEPDIKTAGCAVLHYVLLGARVPNTPPHNPLHSRNFLLLKSQLYNEGFLPLLLRVIKTSHDDQLRTWATKAFASFAEQHSETLQAALREGALDELVGLMQQECVGGRHRGGDVSFLRAAAYAVAVLCGHAHHTRDAQAHLKAHLSSLDYLSDPPVDVLRALWALVTSTSDPLALSSLLLAVRHVLALCPAAVLQDEYVATLVHLLAQGMRSLRRTLGGGGAGNSGGRAGSPMLFSPTMQSGGVAWSEVDGDLGLLQGASIELVACTMHSLLDALEEPTLMQGAVNQSRLVLEVHELLRLPCPSPSLHSLTLLGLEMAELLGRHQHYSAVLQLADSLAVLMTRERAHECMLRILRVLGCLSNAEPGRIYELADYGLVQALFNCLRRFKSHDSILVGVYGLKDASRGYSLDLCHAAIKVLRALLLVTDNRCRALFLSTFSVGQVQVLVDTHRALCHDVLTRSAAAPLPQLAELNAALKSLLIDMRGLHSQSFAPAPLTSPSLSQNGVGGGRHHCPSPGPGVSSGCHVSSSAVTQLISEALEAWRDDLLELMHSPHPLTLPETLLEGLHEPATRGATRAPVIRCLDANGRPVKVRIIPEWPGVREVETLVPCSASLFELREHIFDLYHFKRDGMRLFHVRHTSSSSSSSAFSSSSSEGAGHLPYELTEDAALGSLLRLYGESRETFVLRVRSSVPILRMSEEPLVTPASKHGVRQALAEAGLHVTGRMAEALDGLYRTFSELALDNPEAQGLTWEAFQKVVRWPGPYASGASRTRILWDLMDKEGRGALGYAVVCVGLCTLLAKQLDATTAWVHACLEAQPGVGVGREALAKFLHGVYSDRPEADARRLGEQVFARWERSGESCPGLSLDAFREAVRENERLINGMGALQDVYFVDTAGQVGGLGGYGQRGGRHQGFHQGGGNRNRRDRSITQFDEERANPHHQHKPQRAHRSRSRSADFYQQNVY